MGRGAKIARRSFLVGSAAIAGGVVFGVYEARKTLPNPLVGGAGQTVLSPYVIIDGRGVTLIAPRAEMGQGVQSTLAALLAEELDVDWQDVRIEHGPPAPVYFNGALVAAGMPWRDYDESDLKKRIKRSTALLPKILGLQATGGSTSMVDGFVKMRKAGAAARMVLVTAAAARLGIAADTLKTANGAVIAPDGTRLPYSGLAEAAAKLAPPRDPALRARADWRYVGTTMRRKDIPAKSTGTATYAIDTLAPDMVFATVRMNPKLGGPMVSYDDTTARGMDGVLKVVDLGTGIGVIARNTWLAFQAADAVDVVWGDAPYPAGTEAIFDRISAAFDGKANSVLRDDGAALDVLESAAPETVIEAEYRQPYLAHTTMEPMNATARLDPGALELWAGNQTPVLQRDAAAAAVGLKPEQVTVHTPFMGGGFGRRFETDFTVYAARMAAAMPGVTVKTTWSREEDIRHDAYRPGAVARFRAVLGGVGPVAVSARLAAPSVTRQAMGRAGIGPMAGPDKGMVEGLFDQPYAIENYRVAGYISDVAVPVGFWRSVGSSHNGFFHESFLDEIAYAAGHDPVEMRLELMHAADPVSARVLEKVAEMAVWTGATPEGVGRGVAFTHSFGTPVAEIIEISQTGTGISLDKAWIAADVGTLLDPDNARAQLISGMIYGLSAAIYGEITFADAMVEQANFPDYDALRIQSTPEFSVSILENKADISGIGEPGTPPAMPALANAVFDLTGQRIRTLPLGKVLSFDA